MKRAQENNISEFVDIVICDGGSTDGSTDDGILKELGVNTLLIKQDDGKQGAQLRMGFYWALNRGYDGFITIDGNDKDSIEDVPKFIEKLEEGYDFIQGSRYIDGGKAINIPKVREMAIKYIHAPAISKMCKKKYTDTTSLYRGYSRNYLLDERVQPFREIFKSYESPLSIDKVLE